MDHWNSLTTLYFIFLNSFFINKNESVFEPRKKTGQKSKPMKIDNLCTIDPITFTETSNNVSINFIPEEINAMRDAS